LTHKRPHRRRQLLRQRRGREFLQLA